MKHLILRIIHKLTEMADRAASQEAIRILRAKGQKVAGDAVFGKRLELHIASDSTLCIGEGVEVNNDCWVIAHPGDTLDIGEKVFISQHCTVSGTVTIGANTLIGGYTTIIAAQHVFSETDAPIREQEGTKAPIVIGEDVWIGASCVILAGARIGDHAVIGANSTVTGDIPAWAVAVGSPARVVRMRNEIP